jgi:hypothetical protein
MHTLFDSLGVLQFGENLYLESFSLKMELSIWQRKSC